MNEMWNDRDGDQAGHDQCNGLVADGLLPKYLFRLPAVCPLGKNVFIFIPLMTGLIICNKF